MFAGGFDLSAGEEVCGVPPIAPDSILDLVASLVEKSLVLANPSAEGRYRTLETIRDYAKERLVQRGQFDEIVKRHGDYFFAMAKSVRDALRGPQQAEGLRRLELELDNVRAAMARALEGDADPTRAVKLEVALMGFWVLRGYASEGRAYVRASLAQSAVVDFDLAHAHALYVGGALATAQSDLVEAERMLNACLAIRRSTDNPFDIAATLSTLSVVRLQAGDAQRAREGEEEALRLFRALGDRVGEAIGFLHLAEVFAFIGDDNEARRQVERGFAIARDIGHIEIQCECERLLGELAFEGGDVHEARERYTASLQLCQGGEDKRNEALAQWGLGRVALATGDLDNARGRLGAAVDTLQAFGMTAEVLGCLEEVVRLAAAGGSADDAVRVAASVAAHRDRLRLVRAPRSEVRWDEMVAALRAAVADSFDERWSEGREWGLEEGVGRARALCGPRGQA